MVAESLRKRATRQGHLGNSQGKQNYHASIDASPDKLAHREHIHGECSQRNIKLAEAFATQPTSRHAAGKMLDTNFAL
jgi:hypothetical protein